ncbi:MAG TPA: hypothetical protein PKN56_13025 [Leptospiraceae bacterium]|nr:hypothetical protein [Leptospiraceae bacterium]HNF23345.1 hypothetical protein [Leptospiraceae bacterium]HNI96356.1 hypothetical protein [Leptospiraceae bacterium]HNM01555.1 hypothetical protein [Leptospiraceae bacterium]HNN04482.1 hypothetical protein [Leptospiraceae bacterium]
MDKEMSTNCQISINSIVQTADVSLSPEKKEIFFTPSSAGWPVNLDTLSYLNLVNCKDAAGVSVVVQEKGAPVFIADGIIYLDGTNGLDTYTGLTTGDPLLTLSAALAAVTSKCTGACTILMKGGVYPVSSSVIVPTNVSLFGGYDPSDWKKRRADKTSLAPYDTIIDDLSSNVTGNINDPYATIKYSSYTGTKEKSVLDGIMVYSPFNVTAANYSTPIAVVNLQSGAGISIRNVITLDRSNTASTITSGVYAVGSAGTISLSKSSFTASNAGNTSVERHGVVYTNSAGTASFYIADSTVNAGNSSANNSTGVLLTGTVNGTVLVENNSITAGFCLVASCVSSGVTANFATANGMTIKGNTITSGAASGNSFSYGIYHIAGSGLTISGNTITSGTASGTSSESVGIKSTAPSASITISSNTVTSGIGGGSATNGSAGIETALSGGSAVITGNTVSTGSCTNSSCGISAVKNTGTPTVTVSNNILTSGSCSITSCYNRTLDMANGTTTTITGNTITGGTGDGHAYGIEVNSGNFTISSNTITGPSCLGSGCNAKGIDVPFGNVTISNNTVQGGNCSVGVCTSAGVWLNANGATFSVTGNSITAGTCSGVGGCSQIGLKIGNAFTPGTGTASGNLISSGTPNSNTGTRTAVDMEKWAANTDVQRNTLINGNGAGTPTALYVRAGTNSARICSNVMIGGGSTNASAPVPALRIDQNPGGLKIMGNTIIAPVLNANTALGVNFTSGTAYTNLSLDQNIIYGNPSYTASTNCINESAAGTNYQTLVLNNVSNCNNLYYRPAKSFNFICSAGGNFDGTSASCTDALPSPLSGQRNINLNPVFVNFSGNDLHLDPSTPAGINTAMVAGDITAFNGNCGNALDRDGNTRTAGTSIGAYK